MSKARWLPFDIQWNRVPVPSSEVRRFCAGAIVIAVSLVVSAQTVSSADQETRPDNDQQLADPQTPPDIVARIEAISRLSRSAQSTAELSSIIGKCNEILVTEPENAGHVKYLNSLKAWALNRRAEQRIELAQRFAGIGNNDQSQQVFESALSDTQEAIACDPEKWHTYRTRAEVLTHLGRFAEAIPDLEKILEMRRNRPEAMKALFNRAELLSAIGRHEEALADYRALLQADPVDWESVNGCGNALFALRRYREAAGEFTKIIMALPGNAMALANRGDSWQESGEWKLALEDYQASLASESAPETMRRLAWLLATCPDDSLVDAAESLRLIRAAIMQTGETPENLDTLAAALAASGDYQQARDVQTRAISMSDDAAGEFKVRQATYESNERFRQPARSQLSEDSDR